MDFKLSTTSAISLLATAAMAGISIMLGHVLLGKKRESKVEKWVLSWFIYDTLVHFLLEGPFVVMSLIGTVKSSDNFMATFWMEYAKADYRWAVSDPTIVSLEVLTVFVVGTLCLVAIYSIVYETYYRHYIQLVICVSELYGGWMTFCPEWLTDSKNLDTGNFMYLWIYLVLMNGIWVVIPLLLMYQSWVEMKKVFTAQVSAGKIETVGKNKNKKKSINTGKTRKDD